MAEPLSLVLKIDPLEFADGKKDDLTCKWEHRKARQKWCSDHADAMGVGVGQRAGHPGGQGEAWKGSVAPCVAEWAGLLAAHSQELKL